MVSQVTAPVAVLYGGHSAEREVSLRSGEAVLQALRDSGLNVIGFDPSTRPLADLQAMGVSRAVIMLHGRGGEDGTIQGALELMGIPYSGSGVLGSALAMDKGRSKQIWQALGLSTPRYKIVSKSDFDADLADDIITGLRGELMVKPVQEGSSIGMAMVNNKQELILAVRQAFEYDEQVLLEQYIRGEEYTVAILNGRALPSIRMTTPHEFYDYDAKYRANSTEYFCPSGLGAEDEAELSALALEAFAAVGASGWGRVDVMRDGDGRFFLLEVNTVPGMTEKSLVPMAARQAGLSFPELCQAIVSQTATE